MPCYDAQGAESDREAHKKVDKLTRLLCRACYLVEELAGGIPDEGNDKELYDWYVAHQQMDRERLKREKSNGRS